MTQPPPLLTTFQLGDLLLKNRVIMSSLTRGRATNKALAPTPLMAEYYAQRASAGLILSEGTWVSPKAIGYIHVPGIFSPEQTQGWALVTKAVHDRGGLIFSQFGHTGSGSHPDFLDGETPRGPSPVNLQGKAFTSEGLQDRVTPQAFTTEEIRETVADYKRAAENAKKAGFDGIELHAQIDTLIPQFLSTVTNQRTDAYGGSAENRSRLLFEILDALAEVWDSRRLGVKFTPAMFNPSVLQPNEDTIPTYAYILERLNAYNLGYLHWVGPATDLTGTVLAALQEDYFSHVRNRYKGTLMVNRGFTRESGNQIIADGVAELVSFGAPFIANPDLVERFAKDYPLAEADKDVYYTGGEKGYADYPPMTV